MGAVQRCTAPDKTLDRCASQRHFCMFSTTKYVLVSSSLPACFPAIASLSLSRYPVSFFRRSVLCVCVADITSSKMCCGDERSLVFAIFMIGCFTSAVYVDFSFPALFPELYNAFVLKSHHAIRWDLIFPAPRDVIWIVVFVAVGLLTLWSFLEAVIVDPGVVPAAFHHRVPKSAALALRLSSGLHTCAACLVYKPQRAHHCSRCQRCVLKYDHHCPWIGQCVGFFNYKLYLLFVWYTQIFTQVVTLTTGGSCLRVVLNQLSVGTGDDPASNVFATVLRYMARLPIGSTASAVYDATPLVFFTYAVATVFQVLTIYLIAKHTLCSRANMTTVDYVILGNMHDDEREQWTNEFDLGVESNLECVFGDGMWSREVRRGHKTVEEARRQAGFRRWLWRLLPIPAYPLQPRWVKESPAAFQTQESSPEAPLDVASAKRYSTMDDEHTSPPAGVLRLLADDKYLGIVFPTKSQLRHRDHDAYV